MARLSAELPGETALRPSTRSVAGATLLFTAACCLFAWLAGQDASWDLHNYHFYNPFAWLNDRFWIDIQPAQRQTFFNPLLDVPFYWLTEQFGVFAASLFHAAFQGLQAGGLLILAHAVLAASGWQGKGASAAAWALTALALFAPLSAEQLGSTHGEGATATFVIWGLVCFIRAFPSATGSSPAGRRSFALMGLAGVLLGMATGLKLTNGPFAAALLFCLLLQPLPWRDLLRFLLAAGAGCLLGFLLTYGYWGWFLYSELQNPVFPQFNQVFRSGFISPVSFTDDRYKASGLVEWLFYPLYYNPLAGEIGRQQFSDLRIPLAWLAAWLCLPAVLLSGRIRRRVATAQPVFLLLPFFLVAYLLWQWLFSIIRYAVALELLAPLVIVLGLAVLAPRKPWRKGLAIVLMLPLLLSSFFLLFGGHSLGSRTAWTESAFAVEWPDHPLEGAMVLVSGGQAMSFMIPTAPASARFVRIDSNLFYVGFPSLEARYDNRMGERIRGAIQGHDGLFYSMYSKGEAAYADSELALFGLERIPASCAPVGSKAGPPFSLCAVRRLDTG